MIHDVPELRDGLSLTEVLETCDVEYLRSSVQAVSSARRKIIERASLLSQDEWLAKKRLNGIIYGRRSLANLTPEQRTAKARAANTARWAKTSPDDRKRYSKMLNDCRYGRRIPAAKRPRDSYLGLEDLTPRQRRGIIEACEEGELSVPEIAAAYGIHERTAYRLLRIVGSIAHSYAQALDVAKDATEAKA